jgi:hypothetical protein
MVAVMFCHGARAGSSAYFMQTAKIVFWAYMDFTEAILSIRSRVQRSIFINFNPQEILSGPILIGQANCFEEDIGG